MAEGRERRSTPSRPFEQSAAWVVGLLLPVAEAARRRSDFSDIPGYVDDFIIGGFLLFAAWWAEQRPSIGRVLLVASWGSFCGGMYYAFFGQLRSGQRLDVSGLPNAAVLFVKGAIFGVGVIALVRATRAAIAAAATREPT